MDNLINVCNKVYMSVLYEILFFLKKLLFVGYCMNI